LNHGIDMVTGQARQQSRNSARARVRRGNAEDAERFRGELLASALAQFTAGGLDAVSMRAIASSLGVSAMAPYRYFESRSALLDALLSRVLERLHDAVLESIGSSAGRAEGYQRFFDGFLRFFESHPEEFRLFYETQDRSRTAEPSLQDTDLYQRILALHQDSIRATVPHEVDAASLQVAADLSYVMLLGYLVSTLVNRRYPLGDRGALRQATIEQAAQAVQRCLLPRPRSPASKRR
jgi:AcrR family transcriptional regulator